VLGLKRLDLYLQFDRPLREEEIAPFREVVRRRARREPLQYIAGHADFRTLRLRVDRRVLIPRPETELLVEEVLRWAEGRGGLTAFDLGTGSGAIALSLAVEGTFERIVAGDVSREALDLAAENRDSVAPPVPVELRCGRLFEPVAGERFGVVVSNPPYVAEPERGDLDPEVREWEPPVALFGGGDGLDVVREIVRLAPDHLSEGALLALEIGAAQADAVTELIRSSGAFESPRVRRDLAGRERIILAERAVRAPGHVRTTQEQHSGSH
jgi:release factor glutamine methyltransferase